MKKLVALALLMVSGIYGQGAVTISKANPTDGAYTIWYFPNGSNQLEFICKTPAFRGAANSYTWSVTSTLGFGTLTSIVVASNTATFTVSAHGLDSVRSIGSLLTVAGSTTAALNGNYLLATVGSTTTGTFTTSGVPDGTYNTALLTLSTTAPRSNADPGYWSIEKFSYDVSGNPLADRMATKLVVGSIGTNAYGFKCADRAVTTGATAIAFQ